MKLYHYPKCSTCRKAIAFLKTKNLEPTLIDISEKPPTKTQLKAMLAVYEGNIRKLFNTSGMQYRELGMKDKLANMSNSEAIELLANNGMLVKRPFLVLDAKQGAVGFKQDEWETLL